MNTAYATSEEGLSWEWRGVALQGRPTSRDARGARVTAVVPDGRAAFGGRATAEENCFEHTGLAYQSGEPGRLQHAEPGHNPELITDEVGRDGEGNVAGPRVHDASPKLAVEEIGEVADNKGAGTWASSCPAPNP
jgi:hypothetical protein